MSEHGIKSKFVFGYVCKAELMGGFYYSKMGCPLKRGGGKL